jgi:hypothetical protein
MEPFRDDTELAAALRGMRPAIRPEFAAWLDTRAAHGFPREPRLALPGWTALRDRFAATPPRRLIAAGGSVAIATVVIATAVIAGSETGTRTSPERPPPATFESAAPAAGNGSASAAGRASAGNAETRSSAETAETQSSAVQVERAPAPHSGPYASQAGRRDVERRAEIVLGADPGEVRADAAKVFDAVHAADGIVLSSSIRDGGEGQAGAYFELLIPSGKLGDALASFSAIAEVRSRHESTQDITAATVGVGERLQDSRARIEGLLGELATAETDAERAAVEAELHAERRHAAELRSRLSALERRANLSRVSLRIETGGQPAGGGAGAWGIDDGLDDAGRILTIAAGVTLIGLAILAPLAALFMLGWLARRAWLRRSRSHALARI